MARDLDFSGGESVYCINERQLRQAYQLSESNPKSAPRIEQALETLDKDLTGKMNAPQWLLS